MSFARQLLFCNTIGLLLLGGAYHAKGLYLLCLGKDVTDAVDLDLRWTEQRYFLAGLNPFEIWQLYTGKARRGGVGLTPNADSPQLIESLPAKDPAHPPWAYPAATLWLWPNWPTVRFYFASINIACSAVLFLWAYKSGPRGNTGMRLLAAASVTAISGTCTGLSVGQYGLLVTAFLAGALVLYKKPSAAVAVGLLLGLAATKPTIAGPFLLIPLIRRDWRILSTLIFYMACGSLLTWIHTGASPLHMLRQLYLMGKVISERGTFGLRDIFVSFGADGKIALLAPVILVLSFTVIALWRLRHSPILYSFAIAALAGRLWTYHKVYDNTMLAFLMLAFAIHAMESQASPWRWLQFLVVGATIWVPASFSDTQQFQIIQILVWTAAGVCLAIQIPKDPSVVNQCVEVNK